MKKRNMRNKISLVGVAVLFVIFVKIALLLGEPSASKDEAIGLAVKLNLGGDFPNPKEGTAIFDMKLLMDKIILVNNKVPRYVIFTESQIIPGLTLRYNVHDSVFEGGLPLMRSEEVVFLDGNKHNLVYTFKEGMEQKFYFDNREIASSKFDPSKIMISGFAVNEPKFSIVKTIPFEGDAEFS